MGELDAVHDGHADIGEQQVEILVVELRQTVGAIDRLDGFVSVQLQRPGNETSQGCPHLR